jgi:kinetochor protein Mis14/NSL1
LGHSKQQQYINKTFSLASPNLTINGLPVSPESFVGTAAPTPNTVYEPFDTRKRRQVADLITQEEKLLEDVAALKRSVPAKVAADHAERTRAAMRQDEDDLRERVAKDASAAAAAAHEAGGGGGGGGLAVRLQRQEGVEGGFKSAVQGLGRLKRDMPAVVAKMERARVAGEYVVTKGRR